MNEGTIFVLLVVCCLAALAIVADALVLAFGSP